TRLPRSAGTSTGLVSASVIGVPSGTDGGVTNVAVGARFCSVTPNDRETTFVPSLTSTRNKTLLGPSVNATATAGLVAGPEIDAFPDATDHAYVSGCPCGSTA